VDATDDYGQTPLHYAALVGATACAEDLIAAGANVVVEADAWGIGDDADTLHGYEWHQKYTAYEMADSYDHNGIMDAIVDCVVASRTASILDAIRVVSGKPSWMASPRGMSDVMASRISSRIEASGDVIKEAIEEAILDPSPPYGIPFTADSGLCTVFTVSSDTSCIRSPNYPSNYNVDDDCSIAVHEAVTLSVTSFITEWNYDELTVHGVKYSGSDGPNGVQVAAGETITFTSDGSEQRPGFEVCGHRFSPFVGGTFMVDAGLCTLSSDASCIRSPNYPIKHNTYDDCSITVHEAVTLSVTSFNLEDGYDYLTVDGVQYAGSDYGDSPHGVQVAAGATITFTSNSGTQRSGFEICGVHGDLFFA